LTAKNLELLASLLSLKEKADQELEKIKAQYESRLEKEIAQVHIKDSIAHTQPSNSVPQV
jgi:ClpP class serine protease